MAVMKEREDADRMAASTPRPNNLVPGPVRLTPGDRSTAEALLTHAGTWVGNGIDELLQEVYAFRGEAEF